VALPSSVTATVAVTRSASSSRPASGGGRNAAEGAGTAARFGAVSAVGVSWSTNPNPRGCNRTVPVAVNVVTVVGRGFTGLRRRTGDEVFTCVFERFQERRVQPRAGAREPAAGCASRQSRRRAWPSTGYCVDLRPVCNHVTTAQICGGRKNSVTPTGKRLPSSRMVCVGPGFLGGARHRDSTRPYPLGTTSAATKSG
jgi:hypothetical protein